MHRFTQDTTLMGTVQSNAVDLAIPGLICPLSLGCLFGGSPNR